MSNANPPGFLAEPTSPNGAGVLVLHPWWGLNEDTKAFCTRLANNGFVAFAPDLFEGKTADTPENAEALVKSQRSRQDEIARHILDSAKHLENKTGKKEIAVVGFSYGAYHALELSNQQPERVKSVVVFYGTGPEDFSNSQAAYLGHFGEKDDFEPAECVKALTKAIKDAGRPASLRTYGGTGHWFFEPSVKQAYNKDAANLAWERTVQFLHKHHG